MQTTQKNVLIGAIVALIIIVGGVYFYSTKPVTSPVNDAQNLVDNNVASSEKTLNIVSAESKATYELNEKLQGKPTHVLGTTQSIAGTINIDLTAPAKIEIGEVKIDATTFKTDIAKRDDNVRELVFKSNTSGNQYIVFVPTSIIGVPSNIEAGKDFQITITGDMTILGVTKSITFNGIANVSAENALTINVNTNVTYGDFGLVVPNFSLDVSTSVV